MNTLLRKTLMASAAVLFLVAAPVFQPADLAFSSLAHARGGSDDSGGDDHGGRSGGDSSSDDHGGRSGRSGSDDDHSGRSGHDSSDDDDDDRGRGRGRGHDDAAGDDRDDDDDDDNRRGRDDRPETVLSVSPESLAGLLNGSLVAVDQLGRQLEIEVELEHGQRIVKAEVHRSDAVRIPGPITSVTVTAP